MKKLTYLFLTLLIVACSSDDEGDNEVNEPSNCDVVYLASNGVTIKACDDANVGDTGVINGVTYTVVDEAMLRYKVLFEEDVSKLATTKVTDMRRLFAEKLNFNQPIGNWDVSNVTDMEEMFYDNYYFNQDISSWSVDNVTNCRDFSGEAPLTEENTPNFTNCTP